MTCLLTSVDATYRLRACTQKAAIKYSTKISLFFFWFLIFGNRRGRISAGLNFPYCQSSFPQNHLSHQQAQISGKNELRAIKCLAQRDTSMYVFAFFTNLLMLLLVEFFTVPSKSVRSFCLFLQQLQQLTNPK